MSEIFYEPIESSDELARLIDGMKRYARENEFDYDAAIQEANERSNEPVSVSVAGEETDMIRTRGKTLMSCMEPFTKLIVWQGETLQVCYFEFQTDECWCCQLQVINGFKIPLGGGAKDVIRRILDDEKGTMSPEGTPDHVFVAFQAVQR
jgi:hypothetical protein